MFKNVLFYFSILFLFSSCITNKDLDIFKFNENTSINVHRNIITVSNGDLLHVEIKSLTPTNYDFFNKTQDNSSSSRLYNPYIYGYLVNDSGYVSLPILGEIYVYGKSLQEVEKSIKKVAGDYLSNPFVKVVLLNFNITVLGEVNSPGTINVVDPTMNIIDVIGKANGLTAIANRKKVKVIRFNSESPEIYYLDLSDVSLTKSDYFYVKPRDIIIVEPVKKRFFVINSLSSGLSLLISSLTLYFLLNQSN